MQVARPVGREAASRKYDILSALMAHALSQDKMRQRQVMRLMVLITSRYNWQRDELCTGQEEIARLWSVDTRTVKREMARFRSLGWLVLKRQGARGRVSLYGLDLDRLMADTRDAWGLIGADFAARLAPEEACTKTNVVPLRPAPPPESDGTLWAAAAARLHSENPAGYAAWFQKLTEAGRRDGVLVLLAPTRFQAEYINTHLAAGLRAAVRAFDPAVRDVVVET